MKLVSIIVPIYNMETFVSRGVQCLKAQTYPNLEILLIDDGSIDGSGIACDREAQMDRRIRVY
ncbi:MAG: glycosyltransferase family 2 protein, partial [Anaeromassilibacillus sp.]